MFRSIQIIANSLMKFKALFCCHPTNGDQNSTFVQAGWKCEGYLRKLNGTCMSASPNGLTENRMGIFLLAALHIQFLHQDYGDNGTINILKDI